jgi:D-glycero-alpha-D-manno-heptose-7-phosphate kinase
VWDREREGLVLSTTIDKFAYISCRHLPPFFEHRSRIVYSNVELVQDNSEIRHPAVRAGLEYMGIQRGVEIHHDGDLPARSGIGTSSTFTVGLLHVLYALKGMMPSKMQLAKEAMHIEQDILRENVGSQDQVAAAFGGLNKIAFHPSGDIEVSPVLVSRERLAEFSSNLLLVFTGLARTASRVAASQVQATPSKVAELTQMGAMVDDAISILCTGALADFGRLLHENWQLKRSLTEDISSLQVDAIYEAALAGGALGGKLLGAGAGGFILFFAPPERHATVLARLRGLMEVPFQLESSGSQIVLYEPSEPPDHALVSDLRFPVSVSAAGQAVPTA